MGVRTFWPRRSTRASIAWPGRSRTSSGSRAPHSSDWSRCGGRAATTPRRTLSRRTPPLTRRFKRDWTMSSATSTETVPPKSVLPPEGGSHQRQGEEGFHASHFFVLVSLLAATVAVVLARPSAPEHLILISLTIGAAGLAGLAFYWMLAPLVAPRSATEREPISESMRLDL